MVQFASRSESPLWTYSADWKLVQVAASGSAAAAAAGDGLPPAAGAVALSAGGAAGGAAAAAPSAPAAAASQPSPAFAAEVDAEPDASAVEEESSVEPVPPPLPPSEQACFWKPRGGTACPSTNRIAGCSTAACGFSHCKLLVLKRGWPACSVHPISREEFLREETG